MDDGPVLNVAFIAGMARSGTSWLGEIVDSSPDVKYCFQPMFAYAFKDRIGYDSTASDLQRFFADLYETSDPFVLQIDKRSTGEFPCFAKNDSPSHLAFKENRYQYLIPRILERATNLKLVSVVRHPCGAMLSWLRNPKEFPPNADPSREWRFGACKNQGREENFFGYFKWKETAHLYLDMAEKYPKRTIVVRYEDLVREPLRETGAIFRFLELELGEQTRRFLDACHTKHVESPYSVFRNKSVADRWRTELPPSIRDEILSDLTGTRLAQFINQ